MQSFVFVACFLAALTSANPVEVERRFHGGYSASHQQQQQQSESSSSSINTYGGGAGGFGGGFGGIGGGIGGGFGGFGGIGGVGGGGMSSYSSQSSSSSSYSSDSVINSFNDLGSQIGAIQGMMSGGGFTQSMAVQQMTQLASGMQYALSQSVGCGCYGQGGFTSSASSVFSQFHSLITSIQSQFGDTFASIMHPFSGLGTTFESFINSYQSASYSIDGIFPQGLCSTLSGVIPGLTNMVGFK